MSPLAQEVVDALVEQQLLAGCRVCQTTGVAPIRSEDNEQHVLVHLIVLPEGACAELDAVRPDDFSNPVHRRVAAAALANRGEDVAKLAGRLGEDGPRGARFWREELAAINHNFPVYTDTRQRADLFALFFALAQRRQLAAQAKDFLGLLTVQAASNQELLDRLRNMANTLKATR